jgi:hypothetical protein
MANNTGLTVLDRVASLARKSVKDSMILQTLLEEAGCFGKDQDTLVNSLIGERLLKVQSQLTSPIESPVDGNEDIRFIGQCLKPLSLRSISEVIDDINQIASTGRKPHLNGKLD